MIAGVPPDKRQISTQGRQVLIGSLGEVVVVDGGQASTIRSVPAALVRQILASAAAGKDVEQACDELAASFAPEKVRIAMERLHNPVRHGDTPTELRPASQRVATERVQGSNDSLLQVAILGNGPLGARVAEAIATRWPGRSAFFVAAAFASCTDPRFERAWASRVIAPSHAPKPNIAPRAGDHVVEQMTDAILRDIFSTHDVVVCALESVPYQALLDVNQMALSTGRPCLMITVEGRQAVVGPTVIAGRTACFACRPMATLHESCNDAQLAAELVPFLSTASLEDTWLADDLARSAMNEIARLAAARSGLAAASVRFTAESPPLQELVAPFAECPWCRTATRVERSDAGAKALERRAALDVGLRVDLEASSAVRGRPAAANAYRTVGILGGGTAGYMTALALRKRRPELDVTLIESSKIPILGVGEATTPRLVEFLHSQYELDLDVVDFYHRVRPTWKLGIEYYWGLPGDYAFDGSFQFGSVLEPMVYRGRLDAYCLGSLLQEKDRVPVFDNGDGTYTSLLHRVPFAYHLDNRRFVRYLQHEAARAGVTLLDRIIVDAATRPGGEEIDHLLDDGGERHRFDLYIDASGFRSFLLEGRLRSPFISYASSLFTDSAVMADVPHDGTVKPYTTAESMDHGWCWNIPFEDSDHRGYVFSSAFCTLDQAVDEMRRKNPLMTEPWSLKFRSGRHEHFWKGNVVAVGNAYAFVEPLESTALQMLNIELDLLNDHFPSSRDDEAVKRLLTAKVNALWDNLRGFLAIHYRFNRKFDTPFWRACRESADLSTGAERVALFQECAPLMYSSRLFRGTDPFFNTGGATDFFSQEYVYDVMLAGQQVPARYVAPSESRESFERRVATLEQMVDWAVPQAEALRLLREQPEVLFAVERSEESWINLRRY